MSNFDHLQRIPVRVHQQGRDIIYYWRGGIKETFEWKEVRGQMLGQLVRR